MDMVNEFNDLMNEVGEFVERLEGMATAGGDTFVEGTIDKGFLVAGKLDLQKGTMLVKRAIMQPENF